jgi:hypothetical protein
VTVTAAQGHEVVVEFDGAGSWGVAPGQVWVGRSCVACFAPCWLGSAMFRRRVPVLLEAPHHAPQVLAVYDADGAACLGGGQIFSTDMCVALKSNPSCVT